MIITIIGCRDTSFTTQTGEVISGQTIWFTEPLPSGKGKGVKADKAFLSQNKVVYPAQLPCEADIFYNKYGKVDSIKLL